METRLAEFRKARKRAGLAAEPSTSRLRAQTSGEKAEAAATPKAAPGWLKRFLVWKLRPASAQAQPNLAQHWSIGWIKTWISLSKSWKEDKVLEPPALPGLPKLHLDLPWEKEGRKSHHANQLPTIWPHYYITGKRKNPPHYIKRHKSRPPGA
ncbi:SAYSvFN domain-containing protein 1 isoform X2 [Phocoena sinus]|uniref:SAYSvFN domain-containing protein 1 isoform X2 n=1 Tax=Phocoena sinus TaxID=42100 RepID=UPI0013C466B6|nr:SAYSvFN domain-containing protein 1 isoform X2 [Phocoena sinus]